MVANPSQLKRGRATSGPRLQGLRAEWCATWRRAPNIEGTLCTRSWTGSPTRTLLFNFLLTSRRGKTIFRLPQGNRENKQQSWDSALVPLPYPDFQASSHQKAEPLAPNPQIQTWARRCVSEFHKSWLKILFCFVGFFFAFLYFSPSTLLLAHLTNTGM